MSNTSEIPYGYCRCGCGRKTNIAKWGNKKYGRAKGEPYLFCNGHGGARSVEVRFWEKVNKTSSCWLWTATKTNGYGMIKIGGKMILAHRYSWELHNGPIPNGLYVLHNCPGIDCPACVNPAHLWLGTHNDNMADKEKKGTGNHPRGEKQGSATLTEEKVRAFFRDKEKGMTLQQIADKHDATVSNVSKVLTKKNWAWLWK